MNERLIAEVKKRARTFTDDNLNSPLPQDYLLVENAMLIGASIHMELEVEKMRNDRLEIEEADHAPGAYDNLLNDDGPYATPDDSLTAEELGITVRKLREDRARDDVYAALADVERDPNCTGVTASFGPSASLPSPAR